MATKRSGKRFRPASPPAKVRPPADPIARAEASPSDATRGAGLPPNDADPPLESEPEDARADETALAAPPSSEDAEPPASELPLSVDAVQAQIRELEARLDLMIQKSSRRGLPPRGGAERAARAIADRLNSPLPIERPGGDDGSVIEAARELLSSDYYLRQWGRLAMRNRSEEVDEFGLDPKYTARWQPIFDFLYKRYFRVQTVGAEHIPTEGRCLIVANHSGTIPYDGAMLKTAVRLSHPAQRELRWLAEDFVFYLPFLGAFMNRIGAVRACQENAERLLRQQRLVGVFPEGVKGMGKLFRDRYRLQRFGRGGFIRLCLRTDTPIVPCAVIGAEEANPMFARVEYMAKALGLPYLPVTPTFPWLGPLGLVPAPTKWRIEFGPIVRFDRFGPEAADDALLVGRLSEKVRATIQSMLDRALAERQSIWFG